MRSESHWLLISSAVLLLLIPFALSGWRDWRYARRLGAWSVARWGAGQAIAGVVLGIGMLGNIWLGYQCASKLPHCADWVVRILIFDKYMLAAALIILWRARALSTQHARLELLEESHEQSPTEDLSEA